MTTPGEDFEHYLATRAAQMLLDDGTNTLDAIDLTADQWATWESSSLKVDGSSMTARILRNRVSWAAFIAGLPEVGVVVWANRVDSDDVALARIWDSAPYHFDLAGPLDYPESVQHSLAAALRS